MSANKAQHIAASIMGATVFAGDDRHVKIARNSLDQGVCEPDRDLPAIIQKVFANVKRAERGSSGWVWKPVMPSAGSPGRRLV